jgi:hypothetical protein
MPILDLDHLTIRTRDINKSEASSDLPSLRAALEELARRDLEELHVVAAHPIGTREELQAFLFDGSRPEIALIELEGGVVVVARTEELQRPSAPRVWLNRVAIRPVAPESAGVLDRLEPTGHVQVGIARLSSAGER